MSENWIQFTDTDVFAEGSQERIVIAAIKKGDDLAEICGQVTNSIRQAYAFGNKDVGAAALTIPEGLLGRAIAIALWRFVSEGVPRSPVYQTAQREAAYKEAKEFLDKIASGEFGKVAAPSVGTKHRRFRHCDEDGI